MKKELHTLVYTAIQILKKQGILPEGFETGGKSRLGVMRTGQPLGKSIINIEQTKNPEHGDYACNIALLLAKAARAKPIDIAKQIVEALPASSLVDKVTIAGPGFINFYLNISAFQSVILEVLSKKNQYGCSNLGQGEKIHLEFVSSNPTGPLHVGHGRSAAYGASLGNVLDAVGYNVHREYYVNDAGRQMNILATSLWLRYLAECGEKISFSDQFGYKGSYLSDIAQALKKE
ncbi:MAG: arginine--tRNA ligase, partial [Gammaproteobacteria bacterium]